MAIQDEKCPKCKQKLTKLSKTPHGKNWRCGNCGAIISGPIIQTPPTSTTPASPPVAPAPSSGSTLG